MKLAPLLYTARRWGFSARRRSSLGRALLAGAGIAVGVTALIVVIGVMSGLQKGYIDSILSISSFHLRVEPAAQDWAEAQADIRAMAGVESVVAFKETYALATSPDGVTRSALIRAFEPDAAAKDPALAEALGIGSGERLFESAGATVGAEFARAMGLRAGTAFSIAGIAQDPEEGMASFSEHESVGKTFNSGYYEFDSGMVFLPLKPEGDVSLLFRDARLVLGVKLRDRFADMSAAAAIATKMPEAKVVSWREYNRAFFGALRTEKTVMMLLVGLIFAVVGINIFHAMRRTIASKIPDIALLKAVGASDRDIRRIFSIDGLVIGSSGAVCGIALGGLLCGNINLILNGFAAALRAGADLLSKIGLMNPSGDFRLFSPAYFYLESIPVSIQTADLAVIAFMAIASSWWAAILATRRSTGVPPAEVFRNE